MAGDARLTEKTLINVANNPNVGAIVVVGLGCEGAESLRIAEEITAFGKPTSCITIQEEGGTLKCQARGFRWPAIMRNNSPCKTAASTG